MKPVEIPVPVSLQQSNKVTEGAKLLWLVIRTQAPRGLFTYEELRHYCAIPHKSLVRHLKNLEEHGWLKWHVHSRHKIVCQTKIPEPTATINCPADLILDTRLNPRPKWFWVQLRQAQIRDATYKSLQDTTGFQRDAIRKYITDLVDYGWLKVNIQAQQRQASQLTLTLINPINERRQEELTEAINNLNRAKFSGQALMTELVKANAAKTVKLKTESQPLALIYPRSQEAIKLDLEAPDHKLGFEYQGEQHFRTTKLFPSNQKLREQIERDFLKKVICEENGYDIIYMTVDDLRFERVRQLITGRLPLRDAAEVTHLAQYLDERAETHRRSLARKRA